jgi:hypothetical protein
MKPTKIAMWSGPRNISTALMRSFENRNDTFVSDEPFYGHFLKHSKVDHPLKNDIINSLDTNWESISKYLKGQIPKKKSVWYQKHMAQHNIKTLEMSWINELNNCFLIRSPKEVILSYIKKFKLSSINQLGFSQQFNLFKYIEQQNKEIIIIDSNDLLTNPEHILKLLCKKLNIPFSNKMLSWRSGSRATDGIWGKHWYNNVRNSTSFNSYKKNENKLPKQYQHINDECVKYYEFMYERRIF